MIFSRQKNRTWKLDTYISFRKQRWTWEVVSSRFGKEIVVESTRGYQWIQTGGREIKDKFGKGWQ